MASMVAEAKQKACAFINSGGWDSPESHWRSQCLNDKSIPQFNEPSLRSQLDKCKANGGGNASVGKATAVASNKVYKTNSGEDTAANTVCSIRAGDTATVIKSGPDQWLYLGNISGACAGKEGWVWNDGEIKLP